MKQIRSSLFPTAVALAFLFGAAVPALEAASARPADKKASAAATAKPKPYPLDVCIVTDNDLGSMGEETSMVHEGQVIKFCCAPCKTKFLKNPGKFLAKLSVSESAKK